MTAKRSITIRGHRTSFSVEDRFFDELRRIAGERGLSLAELVASIDAARGADANLSSAIRLYVLDAALEVRDATPIALGTVADAAPGQNSKGF